jgi:hypothetical protein
LLMKFFIILYMFLHSIALLVIIVAVILWEFLLLINLKY